MLDFNNFRILLESTDDEEDSIQNTVGISQKDVNKIKEHLKKELPKLLLIDESDVDFIGSAGLKEEKELSYNLDVILNFNSLTEKNNVSTNKTEVLEFLKTQLKRIDLDSKIKEDSKILECFWKLDENDLFSIYIKPTKSFETAKYFRKKLNESNFSNKYREVFLQSIAKFSDKKIKEYFRIDSPKAYLVRHLDPEKGLYEMERSFIGRHGTLKKSKINLDSKKLITNNPRKIMEMLVGVKEHEDINEYDTFEGVFKKFVSEDFPFPKKRRRIFYEFKNMLEKRNLEFNKTLQELHKKIKEKF